jgi:hypothetical protein
MDEECLELNDLLNAGRDSVIRLAVFLRLDERFNYNFMAMPFVDLCKLVYYQGLS